MPIIKACAPYNICARGHKCFTSIFCFTAYIMNSGGLWTVGMWMWSSHVVTNSHHFLDPSFPSLCGVWDSLLSFLITCDACICKDICLIHARWSFSLPAYSVSVNPGRTDLMCDNVCQFLCGSSEVSSEIYCAMYLGSLFRQKKHSVTI
jgi:hypothetical protein